MYPILFSKRTRLIPVLFLLLFFHKTQAQSVIQGKILDAKSLQPVEAASVMVTGQPSVSTLTDSYGTFQLSTPAKPGEITISCIGYLSITYAAHSDTLTKIYLQPTEVTLKEVVLQSKQPVSFSTLAKIDLDLKPVKNTQELLRIVPGLFVAQHAGGGKAEQIFLRGFDADHGTDVAVSVDGIPVNMVSHAHGQGYADAHFIIPETIANIDFGAGPYYTPYGNLNTAGYVAFSTFRNISENRIQLETGRYDTYRVLGMFDLLTRNKEKQSAYIATEYNYTNGPTQNKQYFNRFNLFGKYNLAISDRTFLSSSLSAFQSKWDASGQIPERAVESGFIDRFGSIDPSEGGNTERYNANFRLTHRFANQTIWETQAYYSRYLFSLYSNFTFFLKDTVNGDEINQAEKRNLLGFQTSFSSKYYANNWTIRSIYGSGIRYDATENSLLSNVAKRKFLGYTQSGDITEANAFAYTQHQVSTGNWFIDAGLRFDYLSFNYRDRLGNNPVPGQGKSILSPKLNIQYTVNQNLQVYLKAGKGFHSNDTRVVVANQGKQILPAAYGGDLGFILKPSSKLLVNVALWYLNLDQEFVYVGDEGVIEPSGKSRREGIDILVKYEFSRHLFANANLNLTKPRALGVNKGEDFIPLAPTITSTGGLFYKAKYGLNGSLTYRYLQNRPANEDNSIVAKGYLVADASLNYTKPKYEIGVSIENLFNTRWNEAQFATESRLQQEAASVTELHFTPGTPIMARLKLAVFF